MGRENTNKSIAYGHILMKSRISGIFFFINPQLLNKRLINFAA
jgi:hypothetical protein